MLFRSFSRMARYSGLGGALTREKAITFERAVLSAYSIAKVVDLNGPDFDAIFDYAMADLLGGGCEVEWEE